MSGNECEKEDKVFQKSNMRRANFVIVYIKQTLNEKNVILLSF